jgi:hypothetical protein
VPAGHSVRSDQIEALLPVGPEQGNPKQLVEQTKSWFRMPAFQDDELLAKSELLQHQVLSRTKKAKGSSEPNPEKVEHGGKVIADRILIRDLMSLISQADGIVARHNSTNVLTRLGDSPIGWEGKKENSSRAKPLRELPWYPLLIAAIFCLLPILPGLPLDKFIAAETVSTIRIPRIKGVLHR